MHVGDHPYRHNVNEYSAVNIPNAISYTIIFDEQTSTEPIHDFIRFYRDDCHEEYYGATKYSGGYNGSPGNWPGTGLISYSLSEHLKFGNGKIYVWTFGNMCRCSCNYAICRRSNCSNYSRV